MNEEMARKVMCAGEKSEGPPEKPPGGKPIREGAAAPTRKEYPAIEPPDPWPEPESPKPDKKG